ncbi:4Fe-4S ferredoxin [Verrucomicrobia bacterium SCGC AG-212-E04]|nr:4Fe-4S ferredoxin [Verrucomicrobia bacterium SCGC AG-212-E04]
MSTAVADPPAAPPNLVGFSGADTPEPALINTCVHCGLCLSSCPTYRETGLEMSSPRGRIYLMKAVSEGRMSLASEVFQGQMSECLNCRACEAVCPSGVQYGAIVEASRAQIQTAREHANGSGPIRPQAASVGLIRSFVFGRLFKNMALFRRFSWLMKMYQLSGAQWLARHLGILKLMGTAEMEQMMPKFSSSFTVPRGQVYPAEGTRRHRVALMPGCIMSTAFAHVHEATIRVLQKNGCEVVLPPDQGCCGALHTHGGDLDGGRELARSNIAALERGGLEELDAIIINAAGCGSTLKEYGHLLHADSAWHERAEKFAAKVKDVHEFLAQIDLNRADLQPLPLKVTYQEPCHLAHAQRITAQPRQLLNAIPQLQLVEMNESALCCGSAGVYNITQPELATALGARKIENALATGAGVIATANPGCALQLAGELRKRGRDVQVRYIVELLDESYRGGRLKAQT